MLSEQALLQMRSELEKIAEEKKKPLRVGAEGISAALLGGGLGVAAGLGTGYLADYLYRKHTGQPLPMKYIGPAAAALGGAVGTVSNYVRRKNIEDMQRATKGS